MIGSCIVLLGVFLLRIDLSAGCNSDVDWRDDHLQCFWQDSYCVSHEVNECPCNSSAILCGSSPLNRRVGGNLSCTINSCFSNKIYGKWGSWKSWGGKCPRSRSRQRDCSSSTFYQNPSYLLPLCMTSETKREDNFDDCQFNYTTLIFPGILVGIIALTLISFYKTRNDEEPTLERSGTTVTAFGSIRISLDDIPDCNPTDRTNNSQEGGAAADDARSGHTNGAQQEDDDELQEVELPDDE